MIKNCLKLFVALVFATNLMAQNVPSYLPKDGLVGWWPFNGNANDESGNANHGTVNGATLSNDRNGKANSAFSFNGIGNYIDVKNSQTIANVPNLSISTWIKIAEPKVNINSGIVTKWYYSYSVVCNNSNFDSYTMLIYESNYIGSTNRNTIAGNNVNAKSVNEDNKWHHLVYTHDQSIGGKFFIDGKLISSQITKGSICPSTNNLLFGADNKQGKIYRFLKGFLDDIAIYNRALTDQEVKQLYEGCTKETATSNSFNSYAFTNNSSVNLTATPSGGTFSGEAVTNNAFNPSKAKLGKNQVKYTFKNSTGCADSTIFEMIMVDTLGNKCSTYDTLKIKVQLTTGMKAGQIATMNVYPNPTSDIIIIEASDVAALNGYSYKMVDLQGKQVYKELVTKAKTEISLKSIGAKGVYILHVVDAQGVTIENKKIVLE